MNAPVCPPILETADHTKFNERVLPSMRERFGTDKFDSWLSRLELVAICGSVAHLSVPTKFLRSWLRSQFFDRLTLCVTDHLPVSSIAIEVRSSARAATALAVPALLPPPATKPQSEPAPAPSTPAPPPAPQALDSLGGSPLDPRLTFEAFLVGAPNEMAFKAAQDIAKAARDLHPPFNPLFVHSAVGLGKTHLGQAVAREVIEGGRRAAYFSAEAFLYRLAAALGAGRGGDFEHLVRSVDVLIFDDVHFLRNSQTAAVTFGRVVSAMIAARRQIVVLADRMPGELDRLDDRCRSQLNSGLVVEIKAPDAEMRARILRQLAATFPGFSLAEEVVDLVADQVVGSARDLAGAVNRLVAASSLSRASLTVQTAAAAIQDLVRTREPRRVRIEDVQRLVAKHYGVSVCDLMSARRTANVVWPRQIAMHLAKALTLRSMPEIGRRFGGRDHTTILHAVRKVEAKSAADPALASELQTLRAMLEDAA